MKIKPVAVGRIYPARRPRAEPGSPLDSRESGLHRDPGSEKTGLSRSKTRMSSVEKYTFWDEHGLIENQFRDLSTILFALIQGIISRRRAPTSSI